MTALTLRPTDQGLSENELLAQLGLPPSASPEDVDDLHLAVSRFLAAAPTDISGWAHAQAAALDRAYLTLTDPVGLQGSALRSPARPPAVAPGGPATPPARRDPAPAASSSAPVAAVAAATALEAATDEDADLDDLQALYASVTPSAHVDTLPTKESRAKASAKASKRAQVSRIAASPAPTRANPWKRVVIGGGVIAAALVLWIAAYSLGGGGGTKVPADIANASPAQSAPAVDKAKLNELMAKLATNPKDIDTLMAVATEFYAGEQYADADSFLDKVLTIDPSHIKALLAKGAVAFNKGDLVGAKASWARVETLDPTNTEVYYDLGFMYLNQPVPDWAGVQREWGKVVELDPTSDLAKTVKAHLDSLAAASMLPRASPAASPAAVGPAASPAAGVIGLSAKDLAYGSAALAAPAGTPFTIRFDNQETGGLPHDVQLKNGSGTVVFAGALVAGPKIVDYAIPALPAGTYTFLCSIHPTMTGTLTVGG